MANRQGYVLPVDPLNEVGDPESVFKNPGQLQFVRTLIRIIREQFSQFVSREKATEYIFMQSPNGTVYRVSVNDAGAMVAVNARG